RRHCFRAGAGKLRRDLDGREIHGRQGRHRQQPIGENAENDQRRRHQRRQHRAANTGFRDIHAQLPATLGVRTLTRVPLDSSNCPSVTTVSPPLRPEAITLSVPIWRSTVTCWTLATLSLITKTKLPVWLAWTALEGTATASSERRVISAVIRVPGHSNSSLFGIVARIVAIPVVESIVFSIMVTWPLARFCSPGTIASTVAVSAAIALRISGRF